MSWLDRIFGQKPDAGSEVLGKKTAAGLVEPLPAEYRRAEKPIRLVDHKTFRAIRALPGDSIQFTYTRDTNQGGQTVHKETFAMQRPMDVDTCVILEVIDDFGLDVGVGMIIGESTKKDRR